MTRILTGRETLRKLDSLIAETREALANAISSNDAQDTRRAEVRDGQVEAYRALANIRMDLLERAEGTEQLDKLHQDASVLLNRQDSFVAEMEDTLKAAADAIKALEATRDTLAGQMDAAIEAYETRVAEIEEALSQDPAYGSLLDTVEENASIVSRAEQKLELAREDRREKGAPYKTDALFTYLWDRQFRTPEYKASPFIRFLDGWVARLCKYDQAHLNYARLVELPDRLAEHLDRVTEQHLQSVQKLEAAEAKALQEGGADSLKQQADDLRSNLEALEPETEAAEMHHRHIAEQHESALSAGSGPAQQARHLLEQGLKATSFPDLRILAAETLELEDDRIVDALVKLRAEEISLELDAERNLRLPSRRRKELETLERLRRRFKRENLDSPYATFKSSAIDGILRGIVRGELDADRALRHFGRAVRRRKTRATRGFGGGRRRETLGLPDVLGDVIWEIAKESGRAGRRSTPWSSGSTRRRAPPRSFPTRRGSSTKRSGRKKGGGGFKTGGGF